MTLYETISHSQWARSMTIDNGKRTGLYISWDLDLLTAKGEGVSELTGCSFCQVILSINTFCFKLSLFVVL